MVPKDRNNKPKRYIAIVKISNRLDGTAYCVKYRFDNLLRFSKFLDKKWSCWKWFNVYSNRGKNKGMQLGSFTCKNKPITSYL
jgi:hypothetical protein